MMLTPEDATRMLQGELVQLLPFPREGNAGGLAFTLWQIMQEEEVLLRYFHEEFIGGHGAARGDLTCFMAHYFLPPNRYNLVVIDAKKPIGDNSGLLGMIDFTMQAEHRQAKIGIWMRRNHSAYAYEAGRLSTRYAFALLPIDVIFGLSPHPYIARFGKKCGWEVLPAVENYYLINGAQSPCYLVSMTRDACEKDTND